MTTREPARETCNCKTRRDTSEVKLRGCDWHRRYRAAKRKTLRERVAILESQVASLQVAAPRGIPA